jgi:hypothetical protein
MSLARVDVRAVSVDGRSAARTRKRAPEPHQGARSVWVPRTPVVGQLVDDLQSAPAGFVGVDALQLRAPSTPVLHRHDDVVVVAVDGHAERPLAMDDGVGAQLRGHERDVGSEPAVNADELASHEVPRLANRVRA